MLCLSCNILPLRFAFVPGFEVSKDYIGFVVFDFIALVVSVTEVCSILRSNYSLGLKISPRDVFENSLEKK